MLILGIHAFAHDSAACIMSDEGIIAAAEEERFTRNKHTTAFPHNAVEYCLKAAGVTLHDIDHVGFGWQPWQGFGKRASLLIKNLPDSALVTLSRATAPQDGVAINNNNNTKYFLASVTFAIGIFRT